MEQKLFRFLSQALDSSGVDFTPRAESNQFKVVKLADGSSVNAKIDVFEEESLIHIVHFHAKRGPVAQRNLARTAKKICDINASLPTGNFGLWNWTGTGNYVVTYREILHLVPARIDVFEASKVVGSRLSSSFEVFSEHVETLQPPSA
ncbi:MAG: hypothetical protein ACR2NS_14055 [Gemmatimonadaceae bacterium]